MTSLVLTQAHIEALNAAAAQLQRQKEAEGQLKGTVFAAKYVAKPKGFASGVWNTLFGKDDTMDQLMAIVEANAKQQQQQQ